MKALLTTDLYNFFKTGRVMLVFIALAAAISVAAAGGLEMGSLGTFFPVYAMLIASTVGMTMLQLDEQSRWLTYFQTLPVTRRDYVNAKYVFTLLAAGPVWILFALIDVVPVLAGTMEWSGLLLQAVPRLAVGLLAPAFVLPPMFRFGAAKGRIFFIAAIAVMAGILGAWADITGGLGVPVRSDWPLGVLLTAAAVVLFALSWALSVRWVEQREL